MYSHKMNYTDYLKINQLLALQTPESDAQGRPAHDEMLFIIVHQVYELWFKQILTEIGSVLKVLDGARLDERLMDLVVARLQRVVEIQKLLVDQVRIMETMTPLEFLEFRDLLIPASGFQSLQFRKLEIHLGLKRDRRLQFNNVDYDQSLSPAQREAIKSIEDQPNLFELVERWLERTPFLDREDFNFWKAYKNTVEEGLRQDLEIIHRHTGLAEDDRRRNEQILQGSLASFRALFDEAAFKEARARGDWRLSYRAIHAALLIQLYRDQPALQLPFRFITALMDMDEWLTTWRHRHALMAKRMLGSKVGTGGSSGYQYLREATDQHRVFQDFFQLTTFFVPRSKLPPLPEALRKELSFGYTK